METPLRSCCRGIRIGKILIQRDEQSKKARVYMAKLVKDLERRWVVVMDPMLATGGSAIAAIEEVIKQGAKEERIVFVAVLAAPKGLERLHKERPGIVICAAQVDEGLDENSYIVPGLGDWGDRYFGT